MGMRLPPVYMKEAQFAWLTCDKCRAGNFGVRIDVKGLGFAPTDKNLQIPIQNRSCDVVCLTCGTVAAKFIEHDGDDPAPGAFTDTKTQTIETNVTERQQNKIADLLRSVSK